MKVHEFDRLENKLRLKTRNSGDRLAWFEYDGAVIVRTKRSHGNKDLPANLIRQQLKVNEAQFAGLIDCSISFDDYVRILKSKGLIAERTTDKLSLEQGLALLETAYPRLAEADPLRARIREVLSEVKTLQKAQPGRPIPLKNEWVDVLAACRKLIQMG